MTYHFTYKRVFSGVNKPFRKNKSCLELTVFITFLNFDEIYFLNIISIKFMHVYIFSTYFLKISLCLHFLDFIFIYQYFQRSFFRTILMKGFHFVVWFLCVRGIKDTQCGFKLLTREAAVLLFSNLHVERW